MLLVGCGSSPSLPSPPPEPVHTVEPESPPHCVLPATRPADLAVEGEHALQLRGSGRTRFRVELVGDESSCTRELNCVTVPASVLDELWEAFVAADFGRLKPQPSKGSPHMPSQSLVLRWSDQRCEVGVSGRASLSEAENGRYQALDDRVFEVGGTHADGPLMRETSQ